MMKHFIYTSLFFLNFFYSIFLAEGFAAGTLVATPCGHTAIEMLAINDMVLAYDFNSQSLVRKKIIAISLQKHQTCLALNINNNLISVAPDQPLYDPVEKKCKKANSITNVIVRVSDDVVYCPVQSAQQIKEERIFYSLTIKDAHNFCVSSSNIIVHNMVPVAALSFVVVQPVTNFISYCVAAGGVGFVIKEMVSYFKNKKKKQLSIEAKNSDGTPSPMPTPPDPDKDKKIIKVNNMEEFFQTPFGKLLNPHLQKTSKRCQGQSIYKVTRNFPKCGLKKNDLLSLDNLHKDHLEVYNNRGLFKSILNLNGTINYHKTAFARGRIINV